MPNLDWTRLAPHQPLLDDSLYIPRPEDGAARLSALIRAGANPIAVVGPVGSGKSTELLMAVGMLADQYSAAFCPVDHMVAYAPETFRVTGEFVLKTAASLLAASNTPLLARDLVQDLVNAQLVSVPGMGQTAAAKELDDLFRETIREVKRVSGKPVALLIDGLEKCSVEEARTATDRLLQYRYETTLVLIIPTALATGPANYDVVANFKLFPIRPVPVRNELGANWQEGRAFLKSIVMRRMDLSPPTPDGLDAVLDRAAEASGGIPRAFLQLVIDAAMYARLANRELPLIEDLNEAISDHAESLRRLLNKGDVAALREADGTDGLEVEPERRLRFLSHGLLLEYRLGDRIVVHPAPLLAGMIARGGKR